MNEVVDFLGRAGPIMFGGGAVQFVIYLLKRRGETRKLDADTDATVVTSASASVIIASKLRDEAMARVAVLEQQQQIMEEQVAQLATQVAAERRTNATAAYREATLRNEIAILKGQQ